MAKVHTTHLGISSALFREGIIHGYASQRASEGLLSYSVHRPAVLSFLLDAYESEQGHEFIWRSVPDVYDPYSVDSISPVLDESRFGSIS